jgi:hypothetical protein
VKKVKVDHTACNKLYLYCLFNFGNSWGGGGWVVKATPTSHFTSGVRDQIAILQEIIWTSVLLWTREKNLAYVGGSNPNPFQPTANGFNDYAVPATRSYFYVTLLTL